MVIPKLPDRPDLAVLAASDPEYDELGTDVVLWRIHRTAGSFVAPWNALRTFGPIRTCRFDPHPDGPATDHPGIGVLYAAGNLQTALAEVFQTTRVVDCVTGGPAASAFRLQRTARLLDLTGEWPIRSGASHIINTGRRSVTRAWARAFVAVWPGIEGLRHTSSMTGEACTTLYTPAADALPARPEVSFRLSEPAYRNWMLVAADTIGYDIVL
ncbi:MAG: RES family NAD+ phosphorylase [Nakamurella sp.]